MHHGAGPGGVRAGATQGVVITEPHVDRSPIVILLARLAVDRSLHGQGYAHALMADAAIRALQAVDLVGARTMLVHS